MRKALCLAFGFIAGLSACVEGSGIQADVATVDVRSRDGGVTSDVLTAMDANDASLDAANPGDGLADSRSETSAQCGAIRHYRRTLAFTGALSCVDAGGIVPLFTEAIDDVGDAVVVMTFRLANRAPSTSAHTGIIRLEVGDSNLVFALTDDYYLGVVGDSVCPGQHLDFQAVAFGRLTDSVRRFAVSARQYNACDQGSLQIESVAFDAWVTDRDCPANVVHGWSYQRSVAQRFGAGTDRPVPLTTDITMMLQRAVTVAHPTTMHVFAQNEATLTPPAVDPPWPPFVCGNLVETAASLLQVSGAGLNTMQDISRRPFSESQGQTHVFLPHAIRSITVSSGTYMIDSGAAVDQGKNAAVTTCGGNSSVDSVIAVIAGPVQERR